VSNPFGRNRSWTVVRCLSRKALGRFASLVLMSNQDGAGDGKGKGTADVARIDRELVHLLEKRAVALRGEGALEPALQETLQRASGALPIDALGEILALVSRRTRPLRLARVVACLRRDARAPNTALLLHDAPTKVRALFAEDTELLWHDRLTECLASVVERRAEVACVLLDRAPYGPSDGLLRELMQSKLRIIGTVTEDAPPEEDVHAFRYALLSERGLGRSGDDLTALVFTLRNAPGALKEALNCLAQRDVNLHKIESRTTREGEYYIFAEIVGHATDRNVIPALDELRRMTPSCRVLGSYARLGLRPAAV
jgi:hypothetical protein